MADELKDNLNGQMPSINIQKQVPKKGFTKENIHKLIFAKPTSQDWLIFFMLVMVLLLAWRYNVEIKAAKDNCMQYCSFCPGTNPSGLISNINSNSTANLSILNGYNKLENNSTTNYKDGQT